MRRILLATIALVLLGAARAYAVAPGDIPPELRARIPDIMWRMADPRALSALSLADLEEFADAYEAGDLKFVSDVNVLQSGGPVTPELAQLVLQIPPGAPFVEQRFVRLARQAYGRGVFSLLKWLVEDNDDGSVSIELRYISNSSKVYKPLYANNGLAGLVLGVEYDDYRFNDENKQLTVWGQLSQEETADAEGGVAYTDGTLAGGRNALTLSANVYNQWRRRHPYRADAADLRQRTSQFDLAYAWKHDSELGLRSESYGLGAGLYEQDQHLYTGNPGAGAPPRSDFSQDGTAGYASAFYSASHRDKAFNPTAGWDYRVRLERHAGDFEYTTASADARMYFPARNILGYRPDEPFSRGHENDVKYLFPTASFALQAQAVAADGDVPFSREVRAEGSNITRGLDADEYTGTKLLALRGEYRFVLDHNRTREAYVFTDNALFGERFSDLESASTYGLGAMVRFPIYGGVKLGGWYGWSVDGARNFGIQMGYAF